jgi:P-type Ca2+ transporter type 2C
MAEVASSSDFYQQSPDTVLSSLNSQKSGLSVDEVKQRLSSYGLNTLHVKNPISALHIFLRQFNNVMILILLASVVLILFVYVFGERDSTDLIEAGLIAVITFMIICLGFLQEYKAEKAVESLKQLLAQTTRVRRDSLESDIDVAQLVPGDIVLLSEGVRVPADIRLIEAYSLQTNEASLTGESEPVHKQTEPIQGIKQINDQTNTVFAGTVIVRGRGIGVVFTTGNKTEIGKIATTVASVKDEQTPLQKQLAGIGRNIGFLVLLICILVFVFISFFAREFADQPLLEKLIHSFIASVALAVAAIPEGLPAVVTISLALGTKRMVKKQALVKKLSSVETLGATDVICSDKTGTLTKGEMTVTQLFLDGKVYTLSGTGYERSGTFHYEQRPINPLLLHTLLEAGYICNNASIAADGLMHGDPTELALLISAEKGNSVSSVNRVYEIPFSSERKMMTVVVKRDTRYDVYVKGAPEIIMQHCTSLISGSSKQPLTTHQSEAALAAAHEMSMQALRTLAFAHKTLTQNEYTAALNHPEILETQLTFIGLQGMMDTAREEVADLIATCQSSGIRVIMLTGDHQETAKAIARTINIPGDVITGDALQAMDEKTLEEVVKTTNIYARINPADKLKIVSCLQKEGHIVAMTGDGVNDAPALKKADIGIAMGKSGTDVAKESADVILLDDHFKTIVSAITEGRAIYHNIQKFVQYLLRCNIAEVFIVIFGVFYLHDILLSATMLLWINVVTDGLPAIALGLDPASEGIMKRNPREFQQAIIQKAAWPEMIAIALSLAGFVVAVYLLTLPQGVILASSSAFMAIVLFEMAAIFLTRIAYGTSFFSNRWLLLAAATTIILQLSIFAIPFLRELFMVQPLPIHSWSIIALMSVGVLLSHFGIEQFSRRTNHG